MKCGYEKAVHEQWMRTKYTTAGAYAVLDVIYEHYQEELEKLPENERDETVMGVKDFLKYLDKTRDELEDEIGISKKDLGN